MKKEILFLNRAYNDMDIQASLMHAFSLDNRYQVRVLGIPCDGDVGNPLNHEAATWLKSNHGIIFDDISLWKEAPTLFKTVRKFEKYFRRKRDERAGKSSIYDFLLKIFHVSLLKFTAFMISGHMEWLTRAMSLKIPTAVIIDEVAFQPNRSQIVDRVLPLYAEKGVHIYVVQTGHHVYYNPYPAGTKPPHFRNLKSARVVVPSDLDVQIFTQLFPETKPISLGNLRMDKGWIQKLKSEILVSPYYRNSQFGNLPKGQVKIAFMLSKLSYGVDVEKLKETIRLVGNEDNVAVAIKPHTRGMKFDFMNSKEIGNTINAYSVPSPMLIEWADIILFTGSSVAFHAMIVGKHVGILKYCQPLDTIFDDGLICHSFLNKEELIRHIRSMKNSEKCKVENYQADLWICKNVHAHDANGDVARSYKDFIEQDLKSVFEDRS